MQLVVNGLIYGIIVALSTMGLTITTKILDFFNFAHGSIMTVAAYLVFFFSVINGIPLIISVLLAVVFTVILSLILDKMIYSHMRQAESVALLMTSVGVTFCLRSLLKVFFGSGVKGYDLPVRKAINIAGLRITVYQIIIIIVSLVVMFLIHFFMTKTKIGKSMRAVADNVDLARISGIDMERVYRWTWVLGTALAVLAGFFLALDTRLVPMMGWNILIPVFVAMVIGGIGSIYGAVIGAMIVGLSMEIAAGFIPPTYKLGISFLMMIIVLLWRPMGIFKESKLK